MLTVVGDPDARNDPLEEARIILRFVEEWRPGLRTDHLWYALAPLLCALVAVLVTGRASAVVAVLLGSVLAVPLVRVVTGPRGRWSPRER